MNRQFTSHSFLSILQTVQPSRWTTFGSAALFILALVSSAQGFAAKSLFGEQADILSAEQAFIPSVTAGKGSSAEVTFTIADGYYLYRDKLSFSSADNGVTIGDPTLPPSQVIDDEFFGQMHTYRNTATVTLPIERADNLRDINITVGFQGCADIGLCYPPVTQILQVQLASKNDTSNSLADLLSRARNTTNNAKQDALSQNQSSSAVNVTIPGLASFGNNELALLSPQQAFVPQITKATDKQINLRWRIEPGYYLYRDKLVFTLTEAGVGVIDQITLDPGIEKFDEFFGNVAILRTKANAILALSPASTTPSAKLTLAYQGCADIGVCFPPETITIPVEFGGSTDPLAMLGTVSKTAAVNSAAGSAESITNAAAAVALDRTAEGGASLTKAALNTTAAPQQSEQDRLSSLLANGSIWLNAITFLGFGLLLAFTPCVYPMVPILSSLVVGEGNSITTSRAFWLSLTYVLSMASVYTVVGILVGLTGYNIQPLFQNPWVLSLFALILVLLSLSMFGFYELQLPQGLQSRLTTLTNNQNGGKWTGVALMGMLSALIVGPCVSAPLVGALAYIANTGNAVIGGVALFSLSMGMGIPLLLIGTSAGKLLPRVGAWMDTTKRIFGILLLAMAIWMISRFLPVSLSMILAATLALMSGIYFGAGDSLDRSSTGWQRFGKGIGVVISLYGAALLVGALAGGNSFISPLRGVVSSGSSTGDAAAEVEFRQIKGVDELNLVLAEAKRLNKPVMLDFYADWCVSCKEMEALTFPDSRVRKQLANAILIQADVTKNDAEDQALLKHFNLFGPPAIIIYDLNGVEIKAARVVGYLNADKFSLHLQEFLSIET